MQIRRRAGLAAVGAAVVLVSVLLIPQGVAAQEAPAVTVTPNTDLTDGQVVTVTLSGFTASSTVAFGQCPASATGVTDTFSLQLICRNIHVVEVDEMGAFSRDEPVLRLLPGGVDCAVDSCIILARENLSAAVQAVAPLSFRPGTLPVPEVTVTPQVGLADSQVVTVSGTGFTPGFGVTLGQCVDEASGITDVVMLATYYCGGQTFGFADAEGTFTVSFEALRVRPTVFEGNTVTCGEAPWDCFILVAQFGTVRDPLEVPISFGPPVPQTVADCKNGGWRNLANDQGQPFRNQGGCVSWVASQK